MIAERLYPLMQIFKNFLILQWKFQMARMESSLWILYTYIVPQVASFSQLQRRENKAL